MIGIPFSIMIYIDNVSTVAEGQSINEHQIYGNTGFNTFPFPPTEMMVIGILPITHNYSKKDIISCLHRAI